MSNVDCLIVSTGRAASTAIYRYLGLAGNLSLPFNKEPHFWCDIDMYSGLYDALRELSIRNLSSYYQLYSKSKIVIDASVGYFFCLEQVIENMRSAEQMPKVIFLYREPVSRARSLFNELKKKKLVTSKCIEDDICKRKEQGLWWEHYYDNVLYMDNFEMMKSYFDEILSINYEFFSLNQEATLHAIFKFIEIEPVKLKSINLKPLNSSVEAIAISRLQIFSKLSKYMPHNLKNGIKTIIGRKLISDQNILARDISSYLPNSIAQYKTFRNHVNYKDVLCLKK
jgi:hypothetical protein